MFNIVIGKLLLKKQRYTGYTFLIKKYDLQNFRIFYKYTNVNFEKFKLFINKNSFRKLFWFTYNFIQIP